MISQEDKEIGYHIIKYFESLNDELPVETKKLMIETNKSLSTFFDVNTKSIDDFLNLDYITDLPQILKNGVSSTEAGHFESDLIEAQMNPKFPPFYDIITSRKYFEGCTEGTLEHLRRRSRVLSKFRENYPKDELPIDHPNHPIRKALAKIDLSKETTATEKVSNKPPGNTPDSMPPAPTKTESNPNLALPTSMAPSPPAAPIEIDINDKKKKKKGKK